MKLFKFSVLALTTVLLVTNIQTIAATTIKPSDYQDGAVDRLLKAETSQDAKEAILTRFIEATKADDFLARLYCQRGKLRITHTHLPKGIKDLEVCISKLALEPKANAERIDQTQQALEHATRKHEFTKGLAGNKDKSLVARFTALWKLGQRDKAVRLVKEEASPEKFSTMSVKRMLKTGYLCKGSSPNGPDKSFKTRKLSPLWWCDELPKLSNSKTL